MKSFTGPTRLIALAAPAVVVVGTGAWVLLGNMTGSELAGHASCGPQPSETFVHLDGGVFQMGSDDHYAEERPARLVSVEPFAMRAAEVTNDEYRAFVEATGYVTVAEREPPEGGAPGSAVFIAPEQGGPIRPMSWWHWVPGANWRHPEGPGSNIRNRGDHPVTQIAYEDAAAYAQWAGEELPTEAEWEYAASAAGTVTDTPYAVIDGEARPIANTWQGMFPLFDTGEDGHMGTSRAGCFEANAFGLYDMIGNVWEWTATPSSAQTGTIKGGSYLCAPNYCMRYRPAAREAQETGLGTNHIGFRTVRREPQPTES